MDIDPMMTSFQSRESRINLISFVVMAGFVSSFLYHHVLGKFRAIGYPFNTFLFRPDDRFMDFFNSYRHVAERAPYIPGDNSRCHLPFTQLMHYVFTLFSPQVAHVVFLCLFIFFTVIICYKNMRTGNFVHDVITVFVVTFLAYPFLFELDRSHIEAVTFVYFALFVFCYQQGKTRLSVICLAAAIAMKPYAMVFFTLFLADRKYREILYVNLLAAVLTFLSLLVFKGNIGTNLAIMGANIKSNKIVYTLGHEGLYFGHTIYGAIKVLLIYLFGPIYTVTLINKYSIMSIYFIGAIILFGIVSWYIIYVEKEFWKKITLLCFAMLILPYNSPDMRLIHIYVPLLLFMNTNLKSRFHPIYALLFGLLMIPKDYWHYIPMPEITSAIFLQPLIMVILATVIIFDGISGRKSEAAFDSVRTGAEA